jgi:hypothetical protein
MFCVSGFIFGRTEGVGSNFHVLCARTCFRRYRGRLVPFSCFALPDMFFAVPSVSGHIIKSCAPGLIFGGPEGEGFRFHILRVGSSLCRYRGCWVSFSCFALTNTFSTVQIVSGPDFMFCAPLLVFGENDGVGSHFHVLRSRSRLPRYRVCLVPFSNFALPDSFWATPRVSGPVFIFCAPGLIFDGTEGVDRWRSSHGMSTGEQ